MKLKYLIALFSFFPAFSCLAITIDPFNSDQSTSSSLSINVIPTAEALGGKRKIVATKTSGALGKVTASSFYDSTPGTNNGAYFHSQDAGISGESQIIWDGTASSSFNGFGLGGINFTKDSSTAFLINVLDFNAPSNGDVKLSITAFNGSETATSSTVVTSPGVLTIPFNSFMIAVNKPFDFSKVGALSMKIVGGSAADLTLDFVKTNGKCDLIPLNSEQVIVDLCGECGGNDNSCKDCSGTPNGSSKNDRCGVCNGDGASCLGCAVEPTSTLSTSLDQAAKVQEHAIKIVVNALNRQYSSKVKGLKKRTKIYTDEAHRLQVRNWTISWTIPPAAITCTNAAFCINNEINVGTIKEYRNHAAELYKIHKVVVALYLKYSRKKAAATTYLDRGTNSYKKSLLLASQIPTGQDICS